MALGPFILWASRQYPYQFSDNHGRKPRTAKEEKEDDDSHRKEEESGGAGVRAGRERAHHNQLDSRGLRPTALRTASAQRTDHNRRRPSEASGYRRSRERRGRLGAGGREKDGDS